MAFTDLDEELDKLRGGQHEAIHYEFDDDGEVSSESATLDWDYVHPNAIAGAAVRNSSEDLTDALRWVLQDKNQQETAHYWQGAAKLGIDLHALGVQSGERLDKAPSSSKMGKLWHTLGIHHVTQNADETTEQFQIRMNDPSNFDSMKSDSISSASGFEHEFSFKNKAGTGRIGAMTAMRNIAKGFVDPGAYGLGEEGKQNYEIAVDRMTNKVAGVLPSALREQSMYFANKLSSGEKLEFGDSYAAVLKNLPVGASFSHKHYGDVSDLGHNIKGIGEVFGAIHTDGIERHDLRGVAGWKEAASNYDASELRDQLARSGDEDTYVAVAEEMGATLFETFNPTLSSMEHAVVGSDVNFGSDLDPNAGFTPRNTTKVKTPIVTQKAKSRRAASAAMAKAAEQVATEEKEIVTSSPIEHGMPTSIPDQHFREGDEHLIVSNHPQGTPEWHDKRNSLLTAADAGLVNEGKYQEEGLRRKMEAASGTSQMSEEIYNSNFERGHRIEKQNREWYEKQFGTPVTEMGLIENPKYPGLGVSVDGLIGDSGLWEGKAPAFKFSKVSEGHAYYDQVQMQMAVTGRDWADISQAKMKQGYVPRGEDPLEYNVTRHQRNDAYIEKQLPKWNKLARDVRIAAGKGSATDENQQVWEHRPAQQESDFEARLAKFHSTNEAANAEDFESRLQERLSARGLQTSGADEKLSFKDAVRDGVVEAEEEIGRKKAGGANGGGGGGGDGNGGGFLSHFGGMGKILNSFGGVLNQAGHGNFLGAAQAAVGGIPIIGGALSGGLGAMQGLIDRTTDEAQNIGDARVMGVDFNNLNNTQRMGNAFGITREQSSNLMQTTSSAAQGLTVGNADEASKIVVGTRGFISYSDLQQYGENPLKLSALAMQRMKSAGMSKGQISSLLRAAGLDDALRMTDATDEQIEQAVENKITLDSDNVNAVAALSGKVNSTLANSRQAIIMEGTNSGNLQGTLDIATGTIQAVEGGISGAIELVGESSRLIANAMQGISPDVADIKNMLMEKLGLTSTRNEDGSSKGKATHRINGDGSRTELKQDTDLPSDAPELLEQGEAYIKPSKSSGGYEWPAYIATSELSQDAQNDLAKMKKQKPLSGKERADADWDGTVKLLEAELAGNLDPHSRKQAQKSLDMAQGKLGRGSDKHSASAPRGKEPEQRVKVDVSINEFTVAAKATDEQGNVSKATRRGQPKTTTF